MEVVACFLKKYFTLLADKQTQAAKELYDEKAIVTVTINGETETATGAALVDKVISVFADGTVTITNVNVVSTADSVVLSADGFVDVNTIQTTFSLQTTLFNVAKHWYIGFEQLAITIPEPIVEEPIVESIPTPEPETAVEKVPTPRKEKVKVAPAPAPTAAVAPAVVEKPAVAAKPASGWAAIAASAPSGEKPKPTVKIASVTSTPAPIFKPVVSTPAVGVHFPINWYNTIFEKTDPAKHKELISQDLFPLLEKAGINKDDVKDFRAVNTAHGKTNVFIDFTIPDALEKLLAVHQPTIKGVRISPAAANKK